MVRRGSDTSQCGAFLFHLGDELVGRVPPGDRFGISVPVACRGVDGGEETVDRGEESEWTPTFDKRGEMPLRDVSPGTCSREVLMPTGVSSMREARSYRGDLVGGAIEEKDMDLEVKWHAEVDELQEGERVGGLVRAARVAENMAGGDVPRREQVGGPVALVVPDHDPCSARLHRQGPLGAIEAWT
jgi:hypothetical protein